MVVVLPAVRPEETEDYALRHREREMLQSYDTSVVLGQTLDTDRVRPLRYDPSGSLRAFRLSSIGLSGWLSSSWPLRANELAERTRQDPVRHPGFQALRSRWRRGRAGSRN